MTEQQLQTKVITWLKQKGCVCFKIPAGDQSVPTGVPDVLALIPGGGWAALEIKASKKARFQPLQKPWLEKLDKMFYSRVVCPENWDEIKKELVDMI